MNNKKIVKASFVSLFSILMIVGISKVYNTVGWNEGYLSKKNCWINDKGKEVCDDCDKANDPLTGTSGIQSPKNPPCETRDRDCWPGHVAYETWGCHCVSCSTCGSGGYGGGTYYDDTPTCTGGTSTYAITCSALEVLSGSNSSCSCDITYTDSCGSNTTKTEKKIDTTKCGMVEVSCGDKKTYVKVNCPACYRKSTGNGTADYKWANDQPAGYTKVSGITKQEDCEINTVPTCNASLVSQPKTGNTTSCSGSATININQGTECNSVATSGYYNISCSETVKANFLPGNLNVRVGQGFRFNIDVVSTNTCEGTFDVTAWNNAYKTTNDLIKRAQKANDLAEENWYKNIQNEVLEEVNNYVRLTQSYKTWNPATDINEPNANLQINYKASKQSKILNLPFTTGSKTGSVVSYITKSTNILSTSSNTGSNTPSKPDSPRYNPKDPGATIWYSATTSNQNNASTSSNILKVENFKSVKTSTVRLNPPEVYIDKTTGNIVNTNTNAVSGGNYFLTDLKSDIGKYDINITVSSLGASKNSTITNDQCDLGLFDNDIIYRIVDVKNPFNVASITPGANWSNSKYDFENTIKENTWSLESLYKFILSPDDIANIKSSNSMYNGSDAYLGVCNTSASTQDSITKKICEIINK